MHIYKKLIFYQFNNLDNSGDKPDRIKNKKRPAFDSISIKHQEAGTSNIYHIILY